MENKHRIKELILKNFFENLILKTWFQGHSFENVN